MDRGLRHYGIKGQRWGVLNGPPYPLGASQRSASEKMAASKKSSGRVDKKSRKSYSRARNVTGRVLKTGAVLTVAALATYGAYKAGYLKDFQSAGRTVVKTAVNEIGSTPIRNFSGVTPPTPPKPPSSTPKSSPVTPNSQPASKPKTRPIIRDPKTGFRMINESAEESLKNANPLRGTAEGGNNCTYCAIAGVLRMVGLDATAKGTGGKMQNLGGVLEDCFKGVKVYNGSATTFGKSPEAAKAMLKKKFGDNAGGAVGVPFRGDDGGHTFNWEIKNGVVQFLDFQQGSSGQSVEDYWRWIDPNGGLTFAQLFGKDGNLLDSIEVNQDTIGKYVNGR